MRLKVNKIKFKKHNPSRKIAGCVWNLIEKLKEKQHIDGKERERVHFYLLMQFGERERGRKEIKTLNLSHSSVNVSDNVRIL